MKKKNLITKGPKYGYGLFFIVGLVSLFLICSCVTTTNLKNLIVKNDEVIVCGKLRVIENGSDITKWCTFYFNDTLLKDFIVNLDSNGYFIAKLPLGDFNISGFTFIGGSIYTLTKEMTQLNFDDNSKVYYIGDITLYMQYGRVWTFSDNNRNEIEKYIRNKYPDEFVLENKLIIAPSSDEIIFNPTYLEFRLNNGKIIHGELKSKTKDKIYIDSGRILYIIKLTELLSIIDDGIDKTEEKLKETKKNKINYNSYLEIEEIK
jgi:hypothetical protein